jgi:replicative DNA helicase
MELVFERAVAGPNGAGKTTLTQHLLRSDIDLGEYINPDDIAAELTGTLAERTKKAQLIADGRRDECIKAKRSFAFETVMSHESKIEILVRAKEAGYTVLLYFVGTDDPETNIERVALRVALGGHPVPDDKVRSRWLRTMMLLQQAIRSSDHSFIFDNSTVGIVDPVPRLVFKRSATRSGRLPQYELIGTPTAWIKRFVLDPIGINFFDDYASLRPRTPVGSVVTFPAAATGVRGSGTRSDTLATLPETGVRSVPHSIEAEQRLLGALIANGDVFDGIPDFLKPKHMFEPIHQTILEALINLVRSGNPLTLASLKERLPVEADLGGVMTLGQYLDHLETEATTLPNAREDGRVIYELSLRRELIQLGEDIVSSASEDSAEFTAPAQIDRARQQLHTLAETSRDDSSESSLPLQPPLALGLHQFSRALAGALDSAARAFIRTGSGLKTGFIDLDRKIAGLQPSELVILASRPGIGKTSLATSIAYNIARSWKKAGRESEPEGGIVGFFSLEMSSEQIATRVISQQSRIPISTIRRGMISEKEFEIIRDQAIEFQALPFFIDETTTLSIEQLAARAHRLKTQKGLDLLIIDNLELLRVAARADFGKTRRNSLQITRELKKLAKDLGIPVLVLAQLPSKVERHQDRRPRLDVFNDKGAIEQDADVIIFLHREDFYLREEEPPLGTHNYNAWVTQMELSHGLAELIIAKQRNGATGTVSLSFDPSIGLFSDLQPS